MKRLILAWGPAVLWALVLFSLSELREVPEALQPLTVVPPLLAHVIVYATLGVALAWGRRVSEWPPRGFAAPPAEAVGGRGGSWRNPPSHGLLLVLGYLYGALDEWHQSFVPGRTPSLVDWAADMVGVTLGYGLAILVAGAVPGKRKREHRARAPQTRRPPAGRNP